MTGKHTPGPWTVTRVSKSTILKDIYISAGKERIARVCVPATAQSVAEYEANALLLALAPEMFAMLKEATQFVEHNLWPEHEFVMRLKDTISKAQS